MTEWDDPELGFEYEVTLKWDAEFKNDPELGISLNSNVDLRS